MHTQTIRTPRVSAFHPSARAVYRMGAVARLGGARTVTRQVTDIRVVKRQVDDGHGNDCRLDPDRDAARDDHRTLP